MLSRNARLYPHDTALVEIVPSQNLRKEVTWREFDERVTRFANALMKMGIGRGDKVIHWMMNSINWLEAYFGIIRTGAWVVPLNFRFNSQDLKYCADVAGAKAMVFGGEFTERLEAVREELTTIRDYVFVGDSVPAGMKGFEAVIGEASSSVDLELSDEDEAALYFTSGTTGKPKPILLAHKNLASACITENYRQGMKHNDNILLIPPLYHTGIKMHWLGAFIVGGRGTILAEFSPQNVFSTISREGITIVFLLVPWLLDIIMALEKGDLHMADYDLSRLRLVYSGAQPVSTGVVKQWKKYLPDVPFQISYGLTESTGPGCIYGEEDSPEGSIGRAGFNWEARIVDDNGEVLPAGSVGELCVKGDGVMRGYYKNPELTAQTIRKGWLFTGDVARMDERGFIFLVDRKKDVIIYGGENVYPTEIEDVLLQQEKVYDVAVIGVPDQRLGEIPVAIIDPKPGLTLTEEEVFKFCEERHLPRYRRPRRVIFDKVPRSPTGKIEKPKLREKYAGTQRSIFNA
jgi:acyl-CoA synthetase (AMP-forming)/AMP-acid ligase II